MAATVRRGAIDDYEAIAALSREAQQVHVAGRPDLFRPVSAGTLPREAFERGLARPDRHHLVAVEHGRVVGYLVADVVERVEGPLRFAERVLYVQYMGVAGTARRRGYGRLLLQSADELARGLGLGRLVLEVWAFNAAARAFYAAEGFAELTLHLERAVPEALRK